VVDPAPQRAYRAACPNCGAPVDFRSPSSAFAVCSYCQSQVVRDGDTLRRIGQGAELFDDHSPLQLGAGGTLAGTAFTLVGRRQYRTSDGTWNEWHALFDNGRSGWLSEDNGRYVFAFDAELATPVPPAETLRAGGRVVVMGQAWSVASVVSAMLIAAQGELPAPPVTGRAFVVADLRNTQGEVATLDYGDAGAPTWSVGRTVALAELAMHGLADVAEKTLSGRSVNCPSCGNSVAVTLTTTQSVVCGQCHAVIDLTSAAQGDVGGALAHYQQQGGGSEPLIPLGTVGTLGVAGRPAVPWQVVGYAERRDLPDSDEDESTFWREYLLYHRTEGFAFLVDAEDGWSAVVPMTGAPEVRGNVARTAGVTYAEQYTYRAEVTWVLGEFYWKLARGQQAVVTDYTGTGPAQRRRLSREVMQGDGTAEVTWSEGEALDAETVRQAFRLPEAAKAALARDVTPLTSAKTTSWQTVAIWVVFILMAIVVTQCSDDDCDDVRNTFGAASLEYRQCMDNRASGSSRGGSFGGFSTGGGHK
jgi:endogenous inhibitor of DNA gyrase (YacG/DUF329 family)